MPPFLLEVSSSGTLSSLVSLAPNLEVPRGNADRLLSNTPQPMMTGFDVQMELKKANLEEIAMGFKLYAQQDVKISQLDKSWDGQFTIAEMCNKILMKELVVSLNA